MTVYTNTDVTELKGVETQSGETASPANQAEQKKTNERLGNFGALTAFEHSTSGTAAEELPSHTVPEGVEIVVSYAAANSDVVNVGNAQSQPITLTGPGQAVTLRVKDTDQVYIQTPTAGDGVGVLFEEVA